MHYQLPIKNKGVSILQKSILHCVDRLGYCTVENIINYVFNDLCISTENIISEIYNLIECDVLISSRNDFNTSLTNIFGNTVYTRDCKNVFVKVSNNFDRNIPIVLLTGVFFIKNKLMVNIPKKDMKYLIKAKNIIKKYGKSEVEKHLQKKKFLNCFKNYKILNVEINTDGSTITVKFPVGKCPKSITKSLKKYVFNNRDVIKICGYPATSSVEDNVETVTINFKKVETANRLARFLTRSLKVHETISIFVLDNGVVKRGTVLDLFCD